MRDFLWASIIAPILMTAPVIPTIAKAAPTSPGEMLKGIVSTIRSSLNNSYNPHRNDPRAVRRLLLENVVARFDVDGVAAQVAGPAWKKATPDAQHRFAAALAMTMLENWTPRLTQLRNESITASDFYLHPSPGATTALFNFVLRSAHAEPTPVTLKLVQEHFWMQAQLARPDTHDPVPELTRHLDDHRWVVDDAVVDGQSLVRIYKAKYTKEIEKSGLLAIANHLSEKLNSSIPDNIDRQPPLVILKSLVSEKGTVERSDVIRSSGYSEVDDFAVDAIRDWRFKPALRNSIPIKGYAIQPFTFDPHGH